MKFLCSILIIILYSTLTVFSQWVYQYPPVNASYHLSIEFPNNQIGAAGGTYFIQFNGRAAYTTNGGVNWISSQVPDSSRVLIDICFINTVTGYCAGAYNTLFGDQIYDIEKYDKYLRLKYPFNDFRGASYRGLFLKTTNSGQNWFTYGVLPSNVYYMTGLEFVNSNTGFGIVSYDYSGGVNDGVIKTTNSGSTWQVLTMPENINNLNDILFIDQNTGFVSGFDVVNDTARGVILKTTNAGLSWVRQVFMNISQFRCIDFTNSTTGLAVSGPVLPVMESGSSIFRTTNSGANWVFVQSFADAELHGVEFVNSSSTALIYGTKYLGPPYYKDFAAKTTNYGLNWLAGSFNDTGLVILNSRLLDGNNWYLTAGDFESSAFPVILHTTNASPISIAPISSEIPVQFNLKQNYPNPFNPETNIEFSISKTSVVKLAVYDITGREVSVLVSQSLTAGIYKAVWNAAEVPSGIYFYRISAADYTETKKMMLIK